MSENNLSEQNSSAARGCAPATCSASEEISLHDKRVLRNRMILGLIGMICALDCEHTLCAVLVAMCGFCLLMTAILDRWLGDGKTPNGGR